MSAAIVHPEVPGTGRDDPGKEDSADCDRPVELDDHNPASRHGCRRYFTRTTFTLRTTVRPASRTSARAR
jgi:hypothetical protein